MLAEARGWYGEADPPRPDPDLGTAESGPARPPPRNLGTRSPGSPSARRPRQRLVASLCRRLGAPPVPSSSKRSPSSAGLAFRYNAHPSGNLFLGDTMGGGVGLIDFDEDGLVDVYFVAGCPLPIPPGHDFTPNKLYRNRGDGTFEDATEKAGVAGHGYGMGCSVADYDNDGHDDLYVTGLARSILYRNRGNGTFEDVTERARVGTARWSTASGFGDLDGDGDLDLMVVTYVAADPKDVPECLDPTGRRFHCPPGQFTPEHDLLFRNDGDGTFTDVSRAAGVEVPGGLGLGLAIADFDEDGKLDLFVANDAAPNFLFRNLGGWKFEEVGVAAGLAYDGSGRATASMGVVAEDFNGDARVDLLHVNFLNEASTLLRNLGGGLFDDITAPAGLDSNGRTTTGFGALAFDLENDGRLDLFIANGHVDDRPWANHPMPQRPNLFRSRRRAGSPWPRRRPTPTSPGRGGPRRGVRRPRQRRPDRPRRRPPRRPGSAAAQRDDRRRALGHPAPGRRRPVGPDPRGCPRHLPGRRPDGDPLAGHRDELPGSQRPPAEFRPRGQSDGGPASRSAGRPAAPRPGPTSPPTASSTVQEGRDPVPDPGPASPPR